MVPAQDGTKLVLWDLENVPISFYDCLKCVAYIQTIAFRHFTIDFASVSTTLHLEKGNSVIIFSILLMENLELNDIMKQEEFDNTKGVIRIQKPKNDKQHNGQTKNDKQRSTKHTHRTKYRVIRTALKTGMNSGAPEG